MIMLLPVPFQHSEQGQAEPQTLMRIIQCPVALLPVLADGLKRWALLFAGFVAAVGLHLICLSWLLN